MTMCGGRLLLESRENGERHSLKRLATVCFAITLANHSSVLGWADATVTPSRIERDEDEPSTDCEVVAIAEIHV